MVVCIDESLMLWNGRLAFRQFVQDIIVYTDIQHYEGLGMSGSTVMTMLAPHLGKGHTMYVDNWDSSPTLFKHLLSNRTGGLCDSQVEQQGNAWKSDAGRCREGR